MLCYVKSYEVPNAAEQSKAGQSRAGQGRARQSRAGKAQPSEKHKAKASQGHGPSAPGGPGHKNEPWAPRAAIRPKMQQIHRKNEPPARTVRPTEEITHIPPIKIPYKNRWKTTLVHFWNTSRTRAVFFTPL